MKKKLLATVLTLALSLTIVKPSTIYAADNEKVTQAIATAEEKSFDTDYSVTWSDEVEECWSKITLNEQGIVKVNMTKPENKTLGEIDLNLNIYNENKKCIYYFTDSRDLIDATVNVGLDKGTYYIEFNPNYSYANGKTTNYKFSFTPNNDCEIEGNGTRDTATAMKTDHDYTGYMGCNAGSLSDYKDAADVYAVTLKKGQIYKYSFKPETGTTIAKLYGNKVKFGTLWQSYDKDEFCVGPDTVFVAPYTGVYYAYIYNYLGDQYKYKVSVNNVTPKKPALKSVKAGNKSATVHWVKTKGAGYQVQYSLNSNFKDAKTMNVSSTKDTAKIKKLSSNKKYYVRVRSYAKYNTEKSNNIYKYSSWSNVKSAKIK